MAKIGRPRSRDYREGEKVPLSFRVDRRIKAMLNESAAFNRHTLGSEVLGRLLKSAQRPEDMVIEGLWRMLDDEATVHAVVSMLVADCVRLASRRLQALQDGRPVWNDGGAAAFVEGVRVAFSDEPSGSLDVPQPGEEHRIGKWAGDWVRACKGPPPIHAHRRIAWPKGLGGSWEPKKRREAGRRKAPPVGKK